MHILTYIHIPVKSLKEREEIFLRFVIRSPWYMESWISTHRNICIIMNILLAINQYCICLEYIVVNPRNIIRVNCLQMYKNLHIGNSFCSRFCSCDLFYFILTVFTIIYLIVLRLKYSCNSLSSLSHVHAGYILDSRSKSYSNNITNAHT